jgi:predicted CopG family antitoxin
MADDVYNKLRELQAKKILTATASVSFSQVINEILRKGLKK